MTFSGPEPTLRTEALSAKTLTMWRHYSAKTLKKKRLLPEITPKLHQNIWAFACIRPRQKETWERVPSVLRRRYYPQYAERCAEFQSVTAQNHGLTSQCTWLPPRLALQNGQDCQWVASCCPSDVRNIRHFLYILRFASHDEISLVGYTVFKSNIHRGCASQSCASC